MSIGTEIKSKLVEQPKINPVSASLCVMSVLTSQDDLLPKPETPVRYMPSFQCRHYY